MHMLVGLGNPGKGYAHNRHNIGFTVIDEIARQYLFSPWRVKFQGHISDGTIAGDRIIALKPMTFVNRSGQAVGETARYYQIPPQNVWILYDELDLAPGKVKVKQGGGNAGHNGLRSVEQHISDSYWRIRFGIGHPGHKDRVSGYVLQNFSKVDQEWLEPLVKTAAEAMPFLVHGDESRFMTEIARKIRPAKTVVKSAGSTNNADTAANS